MLFVCAMYTNRESLAGLNFSSTNRFLVALQGGDAECRTGNGITGRMGHTGQCRIVLPIIPFSVPHSASPPVLVGPVGFLISAEGAQLGNVNPATWPRCALIVPGVRLRSGGGGRDTSLARPTFHTWTAWLRGAVSHRQRSI